MILDQFQYVGRDLFDGGLVCASGGNLSIRMGNRIIITRRGCRLSTLEEQDLIETGLTKNDRFTPLASTELPVHRAIYQATPALAIVHAHPPHTVALSLVEKEVVSDCAEGLVAMGRVPVLGWDMEVKAGGLADIIAQALTQKRVVIVRGHGSFAIGQLLEEAYNYTTALEEGCQISCLLRSFRANPVKS